MKDIQFLQKAKRDVIYGRDIKPPQINKDECNGCGECARVCVAGVFRLMERKAEVINGERCFACGHCWSTCPSGAIEQNDVKTDDGLKPGAMPAVSAKDLQLLIRERRSIRLFKDSPIEKEKLLQIIEAGRYGPTGGNRQDINFSVISEMGKISELRSLTEKFVEKTFKMMSNPVIAGAYSLRYSRSMTTLLQCYELLYEWAKEKKNSAYFPLPFGSAVIIIHAQSFDLMAPFNCSVALYNCSLMAHSLGLGSCFLGFVQLGGNMDKQIKKFLNLPKGHDVYGAMVAGYPNVKYHRLVERKKPEVSWI